MLATIYRRWKRTNRDNNISKPSDTKTNQGYSTRSEELKDGREIIEADLLYAVPLSPALTVNPKSYHRNKDRDGMGKADYLVAKLVRHSTMGRNESMK